VSTAHEPIPRQPRAFIGNGRRDTCLPRPYRRQRRFPRRRPFR
jgi:hypothetical protein